MDWWQIISQTLNNFGVPVVLLGVICYALWRIGVYLANTVVQPITVAHIAFVVAVQKAVENQVSQHVEQTNELKAIRVAIEKLNDRMPTTK